MQDGSVFTFEALGRFQDLAHGMSYRRALDMGVPKGFAMGPDSAENGDQTARHRAIFCESLNISISKTVWFEPSLADSNFRQYFLQEFLALHDVPFLFWPGDFALDG
jgi:hypothetical protein